MKINENNCCNSETIGYYERMTNTGLDMTTGMSAMLKALGFKAMAEQVIGEQDTERLTKYARVIIKNSPQSNRQKLFALFNSQNLYPVI